MPTSTPTPVGGLRPATTISPSSLRSARAQGFAQIIGSYLRPHMSSDAENTIRYVSHDDLFGVSAAVTAAIDDSMIEKIECAHCNKKVRADFIKKINLGFYCHGCLSTFVFQCSNCSQHFDINNAELYIADGDYKVCSSCYVTTYFTCEGCNDIYHKDRRIELPEGKFCIDCAREFSYVCVSCGEIKPGHSFAVVDNDDYCQNCYADSYFYCYSEKIIYNEDYKKNCKTCALTFCRDCYDDHTCTTEVLTLEQKKLRKEHQLDLFIKEAERVRKLLKESNPYRSASVKKYKGDKSVPTRVITVDRLVGVEIEADEGKLKGIQNLLPPEVGIARDGSVPNGVELQTPPASLNKLEEFVAKSCEGLISAGFKGTKKAGLHIHIDARDFAKDHQKITQVVKTFYSIEDMLFSMLPPSRWVNRYCYRLSKNYLYSTFRKTAKYRDLAKKWYSVDNDIHVEEVKRKKYQASRYHSLNIHSLFYRGTVEIRCHSGTVNALKILYWAQILLKIIDYAINHYNEKEIEGLFDMETSGSKLLKMQYIFDLNSTLIRYMQERMGSFNPDFIIKFNKGKKERMKEKAQLSNIRQEYNRLFELAKKEVFHKVKNEVERTYNWSRLADGEVDWESGDVKRYFQETLDSVAKSKVLSKLSKKKQIIMNKEGERGFAEEEDLQKIFNLINIGKRLADANHTGGEDREE